MEYPPKLCRPGSRQDAGCSVGSEIFAQRGQMPLGSVSGFLLETQVCLFLYFPSKKASS